jgi:uncharacterized membrane protein YecN with MAPEG domain
MDHIRGSSLAYRRFRLEATNTTQSLPKRRRKGMSAKWEFFILAAAAGTIWAWFWGLA